MLTTLLLKTFTMNEASFELVQFQNQVFQFSLVPYSVGIIFFNYKIRYTLNMIMIMIIYWRQHNTAGYILEGVNPQNKSKLRI